MLIKAADDKQPQIDTLEALRARSDVDAGTRTKIDREIKNIRAGAKGERDAAYEIDFQYAKNPNRVVIHDLRLEVDGRIAQIDHLIIDRFLMIWVCESKHFAEGVGINEHGEWAAFWGGRLSGIPSPIEQNRHHIAVLRDVFDQKLVEPKKRLGMTIRPQFKSIVLVSNNARISRPKGKTAAAAVDGLDRVVKVEKLPSMITKDIDEAGTLSVLPRLVGTETIERLGRDLAALHRPMTVDWAAKFGLATQPAAAPRATAPSAPQPPSGLPACDLCTRPMSAAEVAYLSLHAERFGGRMLCYHCQRARNRASGVDVKDATT